MKKNVRVWIMVFMAAFMARAGFASIQYNAESNVIWVADYPESYHCALDRVIEADRLHGWGVVTHEASNDTYTVNAELRIGADTGSDTYFRIGDTNHVKPTVIMAKNLVLLGGKQGSGFAGSRNMLSIGSRQDKSIAPVLQFAPNQGLFISASLGTGMEIYNTLITCSRPDKKFGRCWLGGESVVLKDTRILRSSEYVYFYSRKQTVIENMLFEDCNAGLSRANGSVKGCVFRNCNTAARYLDNAIFQNCRFENNVQNWMLESGRKAGFLDCSFGAPQKENEVGLGAEVEIRSTVELEVKDSKGNPVANARITARDAKSQLQQTAVSDKAGKATLVMTEKKIVGTHDAKKPLITQYSYALSVAAEKFKPMEIPSIDLNNKSIPVVLAAIK